MIVQRLSLLICLAGLVFGLKFNASEIDFNLNQNRTAENPLDYWGEWSDHTFHPSPSNWRFPFYSLFLDRFVNGDPTNDDANGTFFEQDVHSNQLRAGGDLLGLIDTLDYIQGMGIKGIYIAGTPFVNFPWKSDAYSPLDLTLLDRHFGDIKAWRTAIDEIHKRNMYVVLDNTMATMGDLIGSRGFLNSSTPFRESEHEVVYKTDRHYHDFSIGNDYDKTCQYPRFWNESGQRVLASLDADFSKLNGCYDSEFDQYGDIEAFGVFPDWKRQLSKFASTQDRLREWRSSVQDKLQRFNCITIAMLDIDGFRFDKALQVTVDAQAELANSIRQCAQRFGKTNFFMAGEITGGNTLGSVYLGRGREPEMVIDNITASILLKPTDNDHFIRDAGKSAIDGAAFHYSIYRSLTRFLGMDGNLTAGFDVPINFVDTWNTMLTTNDLGNAYTGDFDPRHMYGVTNQDVFRWPAIQQGTEKMLLGLFITTLHMPGIPLLLWGEEQAFYLLDSTSDNYVFGRQSMSSSLAWQLHGCYKLGSSQYYDFPEDQVLDGCTDDSTSLDHRDPTHPVRNIIKAMYQRRTQYPVLNDGFLLQSLSNQTHQEFLPGSNGTVTEVGLFSVMRNQNKDVQNLGGETNEVPVWLVYHNDNRTVKYSFDCSSSKDAALISPSDGGTTVKNLLAPYDELVLENSQKNLGIDGSEKANGCVDEIELEPFGSRAYVPVENWIAPSPMLTGFLPGHDARIISTAAAGANNTVDIEFHFSVEMDCDETTKSIKISSKTEDGSTAQIDEGSINCAAIVTSDVPSFSGAIPSTWKWTAKLLASNGIHTITITNVTTSDGESSTESADHLMIRIGKPENPIVFPRTADYSHGALTKSTSGVLSYSHQATGADKWRYSLNWGSSWSKWTDYTGGNTTLASQPWSGTKRQQWIGDHAIVQYWSRMAGSSNHIQHADFNFKSGTERRFPHMFAHGPFNEFGFDGGITNEFSQGSNGSLELHLMTEWPSKIELNVWGMNPDGKPDKSFIYGDIDGDGIIDRMPPDTLTEVVKNLTAPPRPFVAYKLQLDESTRALRLVGVGERHEQFILYVLLWVIPISTATISVWAYMGAFYGVKFNKIGVLKPRSFLPTFSRRKFEKLPDHDAENYTDFKLRTIFHRSNASKSNITTTVTAVDSKRTVLIATMEYDIEDWAIKVKIGGLGVMAQLMGKSLEHQNLIWVVPCVGGIDFPIDTPAVPMNVTVLGKSYLIQVQYHQLRNITYVLLDAPIFRKQTKAEPYPPRMDDLDSAIYYSAWNACIAETVRRFPAIDIYHINDYHGAAAPLYLLPDTIPCCLSLHNAEFQGLWPMRNDEEREEVSRVYNLDPSVVEKYVQFGGVFNLLHAAASYLRMHQKGFGAVGVSRKYGARSYARYPVFWGLKDIGSLPNPDPTDLAPLDPEADKQPIVVDATFEAGRADLRRQAQEWAGLKVDPTAELFVFVGRWSVQKGIDLIADVFSDVLDKNDKVQLICVGPVIDLYGKFAALKLGEMMKKYPGRVYSKPEFTALPPYIFSGAEFALIPSRDEPFGLVAVEFGRKGALGVGARVGGLGQMPGWWFTVESTTNKHLQHQFKSAITDALASTTDVRAMMRARSAKQRFPVAQWVKDLEILQSKSIKVHHEEAKHGDRPRSRAPSATRTPSIRPTSRYDDHGDGAITPGQVSPESSTEDLNRLTLRPSIVLSPESDEEDDEPRRGRRTTLQRPENAYQDRSRSRSVHSEIGLQVPQGLGIMGSSPQGSLGIHSSARTSVLSLDEVVGERHNYKLQNVDPTFNDTEGEYYKAFELMLQKAGNLSVDELCIGDYLAQSEKAWFTKMRAAKLGRSRDNSPMPSHRLSLAPSHSRPGSIHESEADEMLSQAGSTVDEFLLGENFQRPSMFKRWLQTRIGDWPIYSLLLALGQIMSINSYQISLLTGGQGQTPEKLYIIGGIFMVTSCTWWIVFRTLKSTYVLSLPWLFYGLSFALVGTAPFIAKGPGRDWVRNVAVGMYTTASSSGSIFFSLNFGDEGGAPITSWVFRACLIQGTQQVYVTALFYWGHTLLTATNDITTKVSSLDSPIIMPSITFPITAICFIIGILLFTSLPPYYHESPGKTPYFYQSLLRRKIIGWFFLLIILQNYWLSAPYGRNWEYLWSSMHAPPWTIVLLILVFFVGVWAAVLAALSKLSVSHSWILPIFAIGLGAPRWCQMLWGTSGYGLWVPWVPGGPVAGALAGRALWLWLGVLDSIQGVGFGMMLLHTLTRIHVAVTLMAGQLLGAAVTLIAKATAPDKDGPGDVFPDFSAGIVEGLRKPWFWIALGCQLIIPLGLFTVFRKAQLSKP